MPLCSCCERLNSEWLIPRLLDLRDSKWREWKIALYWWHHTSWGDLVAAARSCELCQLILDESQRELTRLEQSDKKSDLEEGSEYPAAVRFQVYADGGISVFCCEEQKFVSLMLALDDAESAKADKHNLQGLIKGRLVPSVADSDRSISNISTALSICQNDHQMCARGDLAPLSNAKLPTRVLDLGFDLEQQYIRLCQPSLLDSEPYVALSYCWGKGEPFITTKANRELRKLSILISSLPSTLRDAVTLTKRLGIRYIWIDALCIVQDDADDWEREAALMHQIYSQALFTLAVENASNINEGLFKPRSARCQRVVPVDYVDLGSEAKIHFYVCPRFSQFTEQISNSVLSQRAWTFQERALSARIVHIGRELNFWDCKEACIGEDIKWGTYNVRDDGFNQLSNLLNPDADLPEWKYHDNWAFVVREYSKRKLTYGSDKLAALDGLATAFAKKQKLGQYVCGLWQREIHRHLLWHSNFSNKDNVHRRSPVYRAPSWSWISIDGPIENPAITQGTQTNLHAVKFHFPFPYPNISPHKNIQSANNKLPQTAYSFTKAGFRMVDMLGQNGLLHNPALQISQVHFRPPDPPSSSPSSAARKPSGHIKAQAILKRALIGPASAGPGNSEPRTSGIHELRDPENGNIIGYGRFDELIDGDGEGAGEAVDVRKEASLLEGIMKLAVGEEEGKRKEGDEVEKRKGKGKEKERKDDENGNEDEEEEEDSSSLESEEITHGEVWLCPVLQYQHSRNGSSDSECLMLQPVWSNCAGSESAGSDCGSGNGEGGGGGGGGAWAGERTFRRCGTTRISKFWFKWKMEGIRII
ncbi:MAG: hypothetical protein MMC33_001401 [Icmadophila ericetorum]|nr:hypothetical protein [Icmadophila ericetorum]